MKMRALVFLFVLFAGMAASEAAVLFGTNATWRYFKGTQEASSPRDAWRVVDFDDSSWLTGNGAFWYDSDVNPQTGYTGSTQLGDMNGGYTCVFLRKTFVVTNAASITSMTLAGWCDDGFVAWLNGTPVAVYNMPTSDPVFDQTSSAALTEPLPIVYHSIANLWALLNEGTNVLAIQAFNAALSGSSDFVISTSLLMGEPRVTSQNPLSGTVANLAQITVVFDEPVSGVDGSDLLVNGLPCVAVSGTYDTYTFTLPQIAGGVVQVTWAANHGITDRASPANPFNAAGPGATWQYNNTDTTPPSIAAQYPPAGATVSALNAIQLTFSEDVQGVDMGDLLINGTPATGLLIGSSRTYTFQFADQPTGNVTVAFAPSHGITDLASPVNPFAGATWNYTVSRQFIPVRINEFLSANSGNGTNALRDEDGDSSDWIELYNPDNAPVDLSGWFLTDDQTKPSKWRVPNGVSISARAYLIVFASGKDHTNALARLHTSFKLSSSSGQYVGLWTPLTNPMSQFVSYPIQSTDVSYGCDRLDPSLVGYFTVPTPGADNSSQGAGFGPEVIFSRQGGTFVTNFQLTLTTDKPGAIIRYLLVNTANATNSVIPVDIPTTTSPVYTGPITIDNTVEVRARAFSTNATYLPGPPHTECYLALSSAITNFVSTLPMVVIHTVSNAFVAQGYPSFDNSVIFACYETNIVSGTNLISSLSAQPTLIKRAGLNLRGSSTQLYPKGSYAVELWDEYNNDDGAEVLGMPKESDWVLYAINQFDTSLMHNTLFQQWGKEMGIAGVRFKFVEVFFHNGAGALNATTNFTGAGMLDYAGIYVLEEKIKVDNSRLDIAKLAPEHTNYPAITGGYLLKIDRADPNERTFSVGGAGVRTNSSGAPNLAGNIVYVTPDGLEMVTAARAAQRSYLTNYLELFNRSLTNASFTNLTGTNHYSYYLDVAKSIDHHMVMVLTLNADAYRLSGYLYKPREGKLTFGPLWDCDRGQGTSRGDARAFDPRCWQAANGNGADFGSDFFQATYVTAPQWLTNLFSDLDFWQQWIDRYQQLRTTVLATNHIAAVIDQFANTLREAQPRENKRWAGTGGGSDTSPRTGAVTSGSGYSYTFPGSYQGEVDFQKKWYFDRITFMDTNFLGRPTLSVTQGLVAAGTVLILGDSSVKVGTKIYYTLDGSDPRAPQGLTNPAAIPYAVPITITNNVRVRARAVNPNHSNMTGTIASGNSRNPVLSSTWSGDNAATYYISPPSLAITEIMFHPTPLPGNTNDADNFEYIELKNIGSNTLNLLGIRFTNGIDYTFTTNSRVTTLAPGAYVLIVKSISAFTNRYGNLPNIAGEYGGNLDNGGEGLTLVGAALEPILDFNYHDSWFDLADGSGFSLVLANENTAATNYTNSVSWRLANVEGGSPGFVDPPPRQLPRIIISEALTHTDLPQVDTIEIHNLEATNVDITGWFLTDGFGTPKKYVIPAAKGFIPAGGFVTFNETNDFNRGGTNFGLSSEGDSVFVFSGEAGRLTGLYHGFDFGPAQNGVSFGRYVTSDGREEFVAASTNTLGSSNALPRVGPIVISEIHYHPPETGTADNPIDNTLDEFIELHNISASAVRLYDTNYPMNTWKLSKGVDFLFPTNITIPAGGFVLLVNFYTTDTSQLAAFKATFAVPDGVQVFGPYGQKLNNDEDVVKLSRPDAPNPATGYVPYIQVDRIHYHQSLPWPEFADGFGPSMQRIVEADFGNDPTNWIAARASAGFALAAGTWPVITQQPQGVTVIEHVNVTLSVAVSGPPPFSIQWRFNNAAIAGATNLSLVLPNINVGQSGLYNVAVFNSGGVAVSDAATVTVRMVPRFTLQPLNTTNGPGSNVTLSAIAAGTGPIAYQWRLNSNNIPNANSTNLILTNLDLFVHGGFYDVLATDSVGTEFSVPVAVCVTNKAFVTIAPVSINVLQGQSARFTVVAGPIHPILPLTYAWSGRPVGGLAISATTPDWVFTNVQVSMINISVKVSNAGGQLSPAGNARLNMLADFDHDGMADVWEVANGFSTNNAADALLDSDGDGVINRDEYIAGTNPNNAQSYLRFDAAAIVGTNSLLQFTAVSNRAYQVQHRIGFDPTNNWSTVSSITAATNAVRAISVTNALDATAGRFYRLQIPPSSQPQP